jgi:DNA-directed RNA polymerase subunit RPC12/RpoP
MNNSANDAVRRLNDADFEIRIAAMSELRDRKDASAVPALVELLRRDPDPRIREEAAYSLESIGDSRAVDPLIAALMDVGGNVRLKAARSLGTLKDARALGPLCAALRDPDQIVRVFSAYALGKIGDRTAIKPLQAALDNSTHPEARQAVECVLNEFNKARPATDITFSCPSCGQHIACDESYAGDGVQCPTCKADMVVPGKVPAVPPPLPPILPPAVPPLPPKPEERISSAGSPAIGRADKLNEADLSPKPAPLPCAPARVTSEIRFFCAQCGGPMLADSAEAGKEVRCPKCAFGSRVPTTAPAKAQIPVARAAFPPGSSEPPKPVAACIKGFTNLGLVAALCGPILLVFLLSQNEKGPLTYALGLGITLWGVMRLFTVYAMKRGSSWSRPLGYVLAVLALPGTFTIVPAVFQGNSRDTDETTTAIRSRGGRGPKHRRTDNSTLTRA